MKVLGIDPGTGRTGWAIVGRDGGSNRLIECGCLETKAHTPLPDRLYKIYQKINALIEKHEPSEAAIEKIFFSKNVKTAMSVGHARGVVLLACKLSNIDIFSYAPSQIKSSVTGYGNAPKKQVQEMVKSILNLEEVPKPDDAADAVAVALTHLAIPPALREN